MTRTIERLKYLFLGLFILGAAGTAVYEIYVARPARACEGGGGWWDPGERICGTPIDISRITGRPNAPRAQPPAATQPRP